MCAVAMHDCLSFSLRAALRRCLAEIGRAGKREVGGASGVQGLRVERLAVADAMAEAKPDGYFYPDR